MLVKIYFFQLSQSGLRGHDYKLYKPYFKPGSRKFFFSIRVVDVWNSLPASLLQCCTVETFKRRPRLALKR